MTTTAPDTKMTAAEVIVEIDWMLAGDVHPALIAQELHRSVSALERLARRHGRTDLAAVFQTLRGRP